MNEQTGEAVRDQHPTHDTIVILDFGSQYSQLIARRVREGGVYSELYPWDTPAANVLGLNPRGFILSGGPASVYGPGAPRLPAYVLASGLPVLGICYGMQLLAYHLGGKVAPATEREYGPATIDLLDASVALFPPLSQLAVWMSHGDRIEQLPPNFVPLARSDNSPCAAMGEVESGRYGVQFHPEVVHTPHGGEILRNFAVEICGCRPDWTPGNLIEEAVSAIGRQVGDSQMVLGLSGGVDSSVVAALAHRALGERLTCIFVDTGLMRLGEPEQVAETFQRQMGLRLVAVNAVEEYLEILQGVTDPERKRKLIGERFVRIFEREARRLGDPAELYLGQGTIYPDVIESAAQDRPGAQTIKSHHNVGGLPEQIGFAGIVEPLRLLFKDEVRRVGEALSLPEEIVWRQPFPGPGLSIRIVGEVTWERLERLRRADAILQEELRERGWLRGRTAQAFVVLLPVRSVGVMGDARTYEQVAAVRAVETDDFMTADWARLDWDVLGRISSRIVNEVGGINRVVYDITSKPPATIEWE
jgi:GMP synthase (glutamine-hydrolysing)